MIRLFKQHTLRKTFLLDGLWSFKTDPDKKGFEEKWFEKFPQDCKDMVVPSCWNNELDLYHYEGAAWYSTRFQTAGKNMNLRFHGITGQAEVYLDGVHIGSHYGGFTGFEVTVKNISSGEHRLTIAVDNTHDDMNTIPLARVDWFHFGGIIRSVEVIELEDGWIKGCRINYTLDAAMENALLCFDLTLEAFTPMALQTNLKIYVNERLVMEREVLLCDEKNIRLENIKMENIQLWDEGRPNLYTFRFDMGCDDLIERTGFRKLEVGDGQLRLNGRKVFLKGVNRHEEHPDWGFSFPLKLMKKDMDIIKDLGCNSIRGSHYPNSPVFLDYCDQKGILFWEEIPMWGFPEEPLKNPLIRERGLKMLEEMVERDYNHPSIFVWSLHNEIDTRTQAAYELTEAFAKKVRGLDSTRPITYATMYSLEDICYPLVDIVSVNKYIGWYEDTLEGWPNFLGKLKKKLKESGVENKPLIMSEFGAAAIYGDVTFEGPRWTENYQKEYMEHTLKAFFEDGDIMGTYIWQFSDVRTAREVDLGRARSFNNKGIVNEYRKPKMAFWAVKKIYDEKE